MKNNEEVFEFKGERFLTANARYVLECLEERLGKCFLTNPISFYYPPP